MRTPGHDFELAAGFLFTEGIIGPGDVRGVRYCDVPREEQHYNVVTVAVGRPLPDFAARSFYTTSSCGICGKASLEALDVQCAPVAPGPVVTAELLTSLPDELRRVQRVFDRTGGLHAAALFDADGTLRTSREDVGRHNAVDKVVGAELMAGALPLVGPHPARLGARQLRDRPEGRRRGRADHLRGLGAVQPGRRRRPPLRDHGRGIPPRAALQRVLAHRAHRRLVTRGAWPGGSAVSQRELRDDPLEIRGRAAQILG